MKRPYQLRIRPLGNDGAFEIISFSWEGNRNFDAGGWSSVGFEVEVRDSQTEEWRPWKP